MRNFSLFNRVAQQVTNHEGTQATKSGLATKMFHENGISTIAIEQNPGKSSQWASLARQGHKVVQFKQGDQFIGVSVDGEFREY